MGISPWREFSLSFTHSHTDLFFLFRFSFSFYLWKLILRSSQEFLKSKFLFLFLTHWIIIFVESTSIACLDLETNAVWRYYFGVGNWIHSCSLWSFVNRVWSSILMMNWIRQRRLILSEIVTEIIVNLKDWSCVLAILIVSVLKMDFCLSFGTWKRWICLSLSHTHTAFLFLFSLSILFGFGKKLNLLLPLIAQLYMQMAIRLPPPPPPPPSPSPPHLVMLRQQQRILQIAIPVYFLFQSSCFDFFFFNFREMKSIYALFLWINL